MATKFEQIYPWGKLIFLVGSSVCISLGWTRGALSLAIVGGTLYLLALVLGFVSLVFESQRFRKSDLPIKKESVSVLSTINKVLEGIICLSGLISFLVKDSLFSITGGIIWLGTIAVYVLCGIAINTIAGIPMKMGYGGWYVPKSKKRK
ncbi:hypothetical protein QTN47_19395 [Danxiaibacter flavus]|uniref:Uncharacterized protein n=1 Tax=Danxiaibacter flavus TaxID=3049108 RepID=A0ABV3ZIG0_9BACT|nr:hypothetical protein QNM32_19405 [Chitinophagaceae bacterium DXS]